MEDEIYNFLEQQTNLNIKQKEIFLRSNLSVQTKSIANLESKVKQKIKLKHEHDVDIKNKVFLSDCIYEINARLHMGFRKS